VLATIRAIRGMQRTVATGVPPTRPPRRRRQAGLPSNL